MGVGSVALGLTGVVGRPGSHAAIATAVITAAVRMRNGFAGRDIGLEVLGRVLERAVGIVGIALRPPELVILSAPAGLGWWRGFPSKWWRLERLSGLILPGTVGGFRR